jgi:zinc/manganese transport system substrate-binding protein/zinc transport system substrate-binding protein
MGHRPRRALSSALGRGARSTSSIALAATLLILATAAAAEDSIAVVTTTADLKSLAEAVGGERVDAASLVPPELDAEEYQPKLQDAGRLTRARVLVRVGLDHDLWLDRLLARVARPQIARGGPGYIDASVGIAVLELRGVSVGDTGGHAHGSGNPHYWLDPRNAWIITANILEGLARIDPAHGATYEGNRRAYLARLEARLEAWTGKLAPLRGARIVAYHNSWPYFARRFGLDFIGFLEPKPGVPPSTAHLIGLIQTMRREGVTMLVREPQEPERDIAFVADKTGASIVTLAGSVGALPQAQDYLALFDVDVEALTRAANAK